MVAPMFDRVFVQRRAPGPPLPNAETAVLGEPVGGPSIEGAFVERATRRLGLACLLLAGGMLAALLISFLLTNVLGWTDPKTLIVLRITAGALILLSLGMWALTRSSEIGPGLLLNMGLVYEVLCTLGLSFPAFFNSDGPPSNLIHIPWVCVWVIIFPLIVPVNPKKSAVVSFIAASMMPVGFAVWLAAGNPLPPAPVILYSILPVYICAGLAVAPAFIVHELGTTITTTRRELRQLGSYRIGKMLGRGGMGEVWRADHAMLARPAAIKLIRGERLARMDAEQRRDALVRFEREAKVTASLRCPHTIDLYDFGVTEDGAFYYVMELLDGTDLDRLVGDHGALPPGRVVHILGQACLSLAEAHDAGLVHRDIKPANIYLCRLGLELDFVKLLDFGLVKAGGDAPGSDEDKLTTEGTIVGTLAFMAPEMADARHEDVRAASDLYSLGAVGYYLLTGGPIFPGKSPAAMLYAHLHTPPEPPSSRIEGTIPEGLERVILACLAKEPKDRPTSAAQLQSLLADCGVEPAWGQEDARRWWAEHPGEPLPGATSNSDGNTLGGSPATPDNTIRSDDETRALP